jgi:hypothetical protein
VTEHTPGPWEYRPEQLHEGRSHVAGRGPGVVKGDKRLARVERVSLDARIKGNRDEEAEANARLIGAAPELLGALDEARMQIEYLDGKFQPTGTSASTLARIRAAIALATGEPA